MARVYVDVEERGDAEGGLGVGNRLSRREKAGVREDKGSTTMSDTPTVG